MPLNDNQTATHIAVNQVMGNPPNWIVYWGITVLIFFIAVVLGISVFIKYPDTLGTQATAYINEIPVEVFSTQEGVINTILVKENTFVTYNQPLIILASRANWKEVLQLDTLLRRESLPLDDLIAINSSNLGELRTAYQKLVIIKEKMEYHATHDITQQRKQSIANEIIDNEKLYQSLLKQKKVYKQEIKNLSNDVNRSKDLEEYGSIATIELEQKENKLLQSQRGLEALNSNLISISMNISRLKGDIVENQKTKTDLFSELRRNYWQEKATLQTSIELWKNRYIIFAPCNGNTTFAQKLVIGSLIKKEQSLVTILPPSNKEKSFLKATINPRGIGKLTAGQKATVAFENYPSNEYGTLIATVSKIAPIPTNNTYEVTLEMPENWSTNYGIVIPKKTKMNALVSIQTKEYSLLERIFSGLLDALNN